MSHTLLASGANADARFVAASQPDLSISQAAMPASRRLNRKSTRPLSSSRPKIGPEKFPLARTSQIPWIEGTPTSLIHANPAPSVSDIQLMKSVSCGFARSIMSLKPPTIVACRLPAAFSMRDTSDAAATATSSKPNCRSAWLNSSALIWPSDMASRKFPV